MPISYVQLMHMIAITVQKKNVTRFYKPDPNRTSDKIKLTLPVDSHTISFDPQHYSRLILRGVFSGWSGKLKIGGFWPCKGPGLAIISGVLVYALIRLACLFCCLSATKKPAKSCNLVYGLQS